MAPLECGIAAVVQHTCDARPSVKLQSHEEVTSLSFRRTMQPRHSLQNRRNTTDIDVTIVFPDSARFRAAAAALNNNCLRDSSVPRMPREILNTHSLVDEEWRMQLRATVILSVEQRRRARCTCEDLTEVYENSREERHRSRL